MASKKVTGCDGLNFNLYQWLPAIFPTAAVVLGYIFVAGKLSQKVDVAEADQKDTKNEGKLIFRLISEQSTRIAVLEAIRLSDQERMVRIEGKVDQLLDRKAEK